MFGTPAATTTATNFSFLTSTPSTGTGLNFGIPTSSAAPATGLSFGLPTIPTTTTSFSFGQNTNPNVTTSAPVLGLGFGVPASTTAAPSFGFSAPTTSTGGLNFNLGGSSSTTTANLGFGLGASTLTTSTPTSIPPATSTSAPVGLGGIATNQTKATTVTTLKEVPPKDQPLPNEILQTVEAFKEMVKQQKQHSSDIARCSVRDFRRVEQEIDQLNNQLHEVESQLQKNRQLAEKLKYDTAKTVQNVEIAQRTHDTPPGLQYENTAPLNFFLNLANQFEREMQNLKVQIETADKYVKNHKNPDVLTPQDLSLGMRRLHESFVALAGRLQSVHSQVESQKETYLNIRKHLLQDTSNPFDKLSKPVEFQVSDVKTAFHSPPKVATGPTPFNNLSIRSINSGTQQHTTPPPAYPGSAGGTGTGFGAPTFGAPLGGNQPSNTLLFGASTFGQPTLNNSFQLQKPPTGNKRGKV